MQTRDLVQVAPFAAASAGKAGRERGPSRTPPAAAEVHEKRHERGELEAARGYPPTARYALAVGLDPRCASGRMVVRRLPTGGPWSNLQKFTRRFRPTRVSGRKDGTTASERSRTMASAEAAKRLGPLVRNQTTTMMLSNVPVRCVCPKHAHRPNLPNGFTHNSDQPCPFEDAGIPLALVGTCCWLGGHEAARELQAFGYHHLAAGMHKDMSCAEAGSFASELRAAADRIERRYADNPELEYEERWELDENLATIRTAACWYAQVAELGFGVFAWYQP
jgi:hypothetical protein